MTGMAQGARTGPRDRLVFALILIIVGIAGLASQLLESRPDVGGWVVLLIGVAFLGAYVFTRRYGFLVPAGTMAGLGVGLLAEQAIPLSSEQSGGAVVLGLGAGFLSIWAIAALAKAEGRHPWPLVPGLILAVIGAALMVGGAAVDLLDYWGAGVVLLGVVLLVRAASDARRQV